MRPCIHGEVCRAYMQMFPAVKIRGGWFEPSKWRLCILSTRCPYGCEFYEPKPERKDER